MKWLTKAEALAKSRTAIQAGVSFEEMSLSDLERAVGDNFVQLSPRTAKHACVIGDVHDLTDLTDQDSYQRYGFLCRDVWGNLYVGSVEVGSTHFNLKR